MFAGRLSRCLNIEDLRRAARRRAHKMVFDYIDGGADDEAAVRNNSAAFCKYDLAFKVLTGVDETDTSVTLLGEKLDVPFLCSPAAGNRLFHTEGERAVAKAAADMGTIYTLSTLSSVSMEEIAALTSGPKWFQLYVWKDRALVKEMIDRAKAAGYRALVLTVDFPITGNRERDARNGLYDPADIWAAPGMGGDQGAVLDTRLSSGSRHSLRQSLSRDARGEPQSVCR